MPTQWNFKNKSVLITGGSRGIGAATAIAFAAAGARVALNFKSNAEAAKATIKQLKGEGHVAIKADISNPSSVRKLVDAVVREFQGLDILVNNAGVFFAHPVTEVSYDQWQEAWSRTMSTNLLGAANAAYCAARHMMKNGGGRIINVGSRGAFRGEAAQPAYGASKAGLHAMSQSLAQALAPHQIFVGAVAPGFVETAMAREHLTGPMKEAIMNQSPLGRVAKVDEVAHAILFLASDQAAFTTGCILDINGASYLR